MYGTVIRQVREAAGLSQVQLAELVGTSQPTLSAYEHGRRLPSIDAFNKLMAACGFVLSATAGASIVLVPFPEAGWFPHEEPWPPAPSRELARASTPTAWVDDDARAAQLDAVLELGDAVRESKGAKGAP